MGTSSEVIILQSGSTTRPRGAASTVWSYPQNLDCIAIDFVASPAN